MTPKDADTSVADQPDELRDLQRMKRVATGCLAFAASVYVGCSIAPPVWPILAVRAAAEAAMIGGIADWFAIVALFRRPLRLPIPHTGLIPRNKDRISLAIGGFVQDCLLDSDEITRRIELADVPMLIAEWLKVENNVRMLAEELVKILPDRGAFAENSWLKARVKASFRRLIEEAELVSTADALFITLLERGRHLIITDAFADMALQWLQTGRPWIEKEINDHIARHAASYLRGSILDVIGINTYKTAGKLVSPIDMRDIANGVIRELSTYLRQVQEPGSATRNALDTLIQDRLTAFRTSETWAEELDSLRTAFLEHTDFDQRFEIVWRGLWSQQVEAANHPKDATIIELAQYLKSLAHVLATDTELRATINERLLASAQKAIANYRNQVGSFVTDTVKNWSAETLSQVVEQNVGKDLQFIRLNGTLVGALVGLIIFILSSLESLI